MLYRNQTIKRYLDDLAARKPAPGGGSAAALSAALGAALLCMVANFTVGKEKYRRFEPEIKAVLAECGKIMKKLLELVDRDVITYMRVSKSKKKSHALYQKSLKDATLVPLQITQLSFQALQFCPVLKQKGNKYLVSDIYVADALLRSAIKSALINVEINLPYIDDQRFIATLSKQLELRRR